MFSKLFNLKHNECKQQEINNLMENRYIPTLSTLLNVYLSNLSIKNKTMSNKYLCKFTEEQFDILRNNNDIDCLICNNNNRDLSTQYYAIKKCKHFFHRTCLDNMLRKDSTLFQISRCPECKIKIYS